MAVGHKEFTQKKPLQLVYLELGVGNGGMLLSLSEEGFRFRAVSPVREDTAIPFAFSLDGRNRMEGTGTVEWVEEDGKSGGMRFTEVSPEFRSLLGAWLNSDSSQHSGREATPAAAAPDDTMEKIRQELRSGYPARPAEVTKFPEQKPDRQREQNTEQKNQQKRPERKPERPPAPRREQQAEPKREPEQKIVARASSDNDISEKRNADKSFTERISAAKANRPTFEPAPEKTPEKISETKESFTASRLFPLPSFSTPNPEQPAPSAASSAFLKPQTETKTPGRPGAASSTHLQSQTGTREAQVLSPTSALYGASSNAAGSYAPAPARPFIPPLEESFEQAWERGKFTSPSDSPHLSRAAAGSIIAIALAVILGALAYNFRQDIGSIFIQLGQSISGDNHPAVPAPAQETKPEGAPSEDPSQAQGSQPASSRQQNAPADSENTANPPASTADKNSAAPSADTETPNPTNGATNDTTPDVASGAGAARGTKRGAAPAGKSRNSARAVAPPMVPPVVKPPENSAAGVAADPTLKNEAAADAASGQEEFLVARDLLHGSNRQQDLSRAVSLLWASVKKGHVPAEVTLADLYRRGDGVEKNCDQARVLLVAASKKGSFEARQMLEQIAERGCQ